MHSAGKLLDKVSIEVLVLLLHIFKINIISAQIIYLGNRIYAGNQFFLHFGIMHKGRCSGNIKIIMDQRQYIKSVILYPLQIHQIGNKIILRNIFIRSPGRRNYDCIVFTYVFYTAGAEFMFRIPYDDLPGLLFFFLPGITAFLFQRDFLVFFIIFISDSRLPGKVSKIDIWFA